MLAILQKLKHKIIRIYQEIKILHFSSLYDFNFYKTTNSKEYLPLKLRFSQLEFLIRHNNRIDRNTILDAFIGQYHLPPEGYIMPKNAVILDIGTNIGVTIWHFKQLYPQSRILGFEMDYENYKVAVENCKNFTNIVIYNNAVWVENTQIKYDKSYNEDAYSITSVGSISNNITVVNAFSLHEIIKTNQLSSIDYLKMDIEGAEVNILNYHDISWLNIVQALNIEFHNITDEELNKYIELLQQQGFKAWKDTVHWLSIKAIRIQKT